MSQSKATLRDVMPLYVGCGFLFTWKDSGETVKGVVRFFSLYEDLFCDAYDFNSDETIDFESYGIHDDGKFQFILNPIENVSIEVRMAYYDLCQKFTDERGNVVTADTPDSLLFATKNRIDCFDLIERGLAISLRDYLNEDKTVCSHCGKQQETVKLISEPITAQTIDIPPVSTVDIPEAVCEVELNNDVFDWLNMNGVGLIKVPRK